MSLVGLEVYDKVSYSLRCIFRSHILKSSKRMSFPILPAASLREQRAEKFKDPVIKQEIGLWARGVRGAITGEPRPPQDAPGPSRGSPNLVMHCERPYNITYYFSCQARGPL
jgi:hypothetical protein